MNITYQFGQIVLVRFPYTDNSKFKQRPALIIQDTDDNDIIVCRITSKLYDTKYDVGLKRWREHGLQLPSVIRLHKIATLEKDMVASILGCIDEDSKKKVTTSLQTLLNISGLNNHA